MQDVMTDILSDTFPYNYHRHNNDIHSIANEKNTTTRHLGTHNLFDKLAGAGSTGKLGRTFGTRLHWHSCPQSPIVKLTVNLA